MPVFRIICLYWNLTDINKKPISVNSISSGSIYYPNYTSSLLRFFRKVNLLNVVRYGLRLLDAVEGHRCRCFEDVSLLSLLANFLYDELGQLPVLEVEYVFELQLLQAFGLVLCVVAKISFFVFATNFLLVLEIYLP